MGDVVANVGVVAPNPLPAPQATLISALAQGVIGGSLNWKMLGIGALVGVGLILLDTILGAMNKLRIPPLAVGIGIYLPMSATLPVVIGAIIGHRYDQFAKRQKDPERSKRLAVLVASGMIVGESLFGVILAGIIYATDSNGNVKMPNVNPLIEMTDMREAQRSYEANLNVIGATRRMIARTLDILKA